MTKEVLDKNGKPITDEIVPDGGSVHLPVTLMDADKLHSLSANLTDSQKVAFADAVNAGKSTEDAFMAAMTSRPAASAAPAAMHRPGYASITDADRASRDKAIADRSARLSERWKAPMAVDAAQVQRAAPTSLQMSPAEQRDARLRDAWRQGV